MRQGKSYAWEIQCSIRKEVPISKRGRTSFVEVMLNRQGGRRHISLRRKEELNSLLIQYHNGFSGFLQKIISVREEWNSISGFCALNKKGQLALYCSLSLKWNRNTPVRRQNESLKESKVRRQNESLKERKQVAQVLSKLLPCHSRNCGFRT